MFRRFTVIGAVFATVLMLMFLKNQVFVGTQELVADLQWEGDRIEMVLSDLGGKEVSPTQAEADEVAKRLEGRKDKGEEPIPVDGSIAIATGGTKRLGLTLAEGYNRTAVQNRLSGQPYMRANPPNDLWYTPLGIDLRGGVEFRLALYDDDGVIVNATEDDVTILRERLDARGLTEPQVSRLSNGDVQVVIPGGTQADAARTRKTLQTAGRLEMREVMATYRGEPGNLVEEYEPGRYRLKPGEYIGFDEVLYPQKPQFRGSKPDTFYRLGPVKVSGQDVDTANPTTHEGQLAVEIRFTATGAARNLKFTTDVKNRGPDNGGPGSGAIGISLDGVIESAPHIISPSSGQSVITGNFTQEEVSSLRNVLKAGSLQVTPQVLAQRVVGPSLGAETVSKATGAMIVALLLILAGMIAYYRRLGVVATVSLITCIVMIYGVLAVFGATLTLPGIAGLVLTVGMAVDANILIFERIREELSEETDLASSIEAGYGRALATIVDANLTTFITALILYWQGTGPIRGFGLTLMIGIATSMFAAVYVGRTITEMFYRGKSKAVVPDLIGLVKLPYTKWRFAAFGLSAVVMLLGFLEFFVITKVNRNFDIDFTGGNMNQVTFSEPMDLGRVNEGLAAAAKQGAEVLDPDDVQLQPYYPSFADAGGATRQWVFKTRDEEATVLEAEKAELDLRRAKHLRQAGAYRVQEVPDNSAAAKEEAAARELEPRINELTEAIAQRNELVKDALREQAFPGLIKAEGAEVIAATYAEQTLAMTLSVIDPPETDELGRVAEVLAADPTIVEAKLNPVGDNGIETSVTFAAAVDRVNDFDLADPAALRLRDLLSTAEVEQAELDGRTLAAFGVYNAVVEATAKEGLRVARPFPSSEHFSGSVATQLKVDALIALAVALAGILAYVAARFEFRYGIGAVIALFHDVPITLGLLALFSIRIDLTVVAALLTIIGYSLNDTIVVFDRIRETVKRDPTLGMAEAIDKAISQTMSRTILTTATTLGVVLILFFFGGDGVASFSATLIIGLILGTYSSVFIAAPVLLLLDRRGKLQEAARLENKEADDDEHKAAPVTS